MFALRLVRVLYVCLFNTQNPNTAHSMYTHLNSTVSSPDSSASACRSAYEFSCWIHTKSLIYNYSVHDERLYNRIFAVKKKREIRLNMGYAGKKECIFHIAAHAKIQFESGSERECKKNNIRTAVPTINGDDMTQTGACSRL